VTDRYSAEGVPERGAQVVRDAVRDSPDAIFTIGSGIAQILKKASDSSKRPVTLLHALTSAVSSPSVNHPWAGVRQSRASTSLSELSLPPRAPASAG